MTAIQVFDDCFDEATLALLLGTGWAKWSVCDLGQRRVRMAGRRVPKTAGLLKFHGLTLQIPGRHHLAAQGNTINQRYRRTTRLHSNSLRATLSSFMFLLTPAQNRQRSFQVLLLSLHRAAEPRVGTNRRPRLARRTPRLGGRSAKSHLRFPKLWSERGGGGRRKSGAWRSSVSPPALRNSNV